MIRFVIAALLLFAFSDTAVGSYNPAMTLSLRTLAIMPQYNLSSYDWVEFCGATSCGDGGGGRYHREPCTPDLRPRAT